MSETISNEAVTLALKLIFQALPQTARKRITGRVSAIRDQEVRATYGDEESSDRPISNRGKAAAELDGFLADTSPFG